MNDELMIDPKSTADAPRTSEWTVDTEAEYASAHYDLSRIFREALYREKPSRVRPHLDEALPVPGLVTIQSLPVSPRYQPMTREGVLALLQPIVSTDEFRPAMRGVMFDGDAGLAVATDGFTIAAMPYRSGPDVRGRILSPTDGATIDEVFPNWKPLVRWTDSVEGVELKPIMEAAKGVVTANKFFDLQRGAFGILAGVTVNGQRLLFDAARLLRSLMVMAGAGTGVVDIQCSGQHDPVIFRDASVSDRFIMIQPIRVNPMGYTWAPVLDCGEPKPPIVVDDEGPDSDEGPDTEYGIAPV